MIPPDLTDADRLVAAADWLRRERRCARLNKRGQSCLDKWRASRFRDLLPPSLPSLCRACRCQWLLREAARLLPEVVVRVTLAEGATGRVAGAVDGGDDSQAACYTCTPER